MAIEGLNLYLVMERVLSYAHMIVIVANNVKKLLEIALGIVRYFN